MSWDTPLNTASSSSAALVNAVGIAASDSEDGGRRQAAGGQPSVSLRYGREDELESDRLGFRFMTEAGYNKGDC